MATISPGDPPPEPTMSAQASSEPLSPESAKSTLEKCLDQTPKPRKSRMEQVDQALAILSSKFPDIAKSFESAKADHIVLTAYVTQKRDTIEKFLQGKEMEEETRKALCTNLSKVHGSLKHTAKWRDDVERQQLPRVEKRAIAVFLGLCRELKEDWEDRWSFLRYRLGDDALAEEDDTHAKHECGGSDFLCANHLFGEEIKKIEQDLKILSRRHFDKRFAKLLSALLRYEKACKNLLPKLEQFDKRFDMLRKMDNKYKTNERIRKILLLLDEADFEHTEAMRAYKEQKRIVTLKISNNRQETDLIELSGLYELITSSYKHDLEEFKSTYSRYFHDDCKCPHHLPEGKEARQTRGPKYPSLVWIEKAINQLSLFDQTSETGIRTEFLSAAQSFNSGATKFQKFRDHNEKNVYTNVKDVIEGRLHRNEVWSTVSLFESYLLDSMKSYKKLHETYQQLKDKIAVSPKTSTTNAATIKTSKVVVFRCFTYLAVMRDHFSNLLFVRLLQSRKDPGYMADGMNWKIFDAETNGLWQVCRDRINSQHTALARVLSDSLEGSDENEESHPNNKEYMQSSLKCQAFARERMTEGSECSMINCDRLEMRVEILRSYANTYLEKGIAQALIDHIDKYTRDVVVVLRHFGTIVQVAQYEEPI